MRIATGEVKLSSPGARWSKAIAKQVTLAEGPVMVVQASVVELQASLTELRIRPPSLRCHSCHDRQSRLRRPEIPTEDAAQDPDASPRSRAPRSAGLQGFLRAWLAAGPPPKGAGGLASMSMPNVVRA